MLFSDHSVPGFAEWLPRLLSWSPTPLLGCLLVADLLAACCLDLFLLLVESCPSLTVLLPEVLFSWLWSAGRFLALVPPPGDFSCSGVLCLPSRGVLCCFWSFPAILGLPSFCADFWNVSCPILAFKVVFYSYPVCGCVYFIVLRVSFC